VQEAYRKQEIGDEDFLAGKKVHDAAMAAYETAFRKEMAEPTKPKAADKKPAPAYTPEQRAEAETHAKETGGHEAVKPVPSLPAMNARPVGYGDHEVLVRFSGTGKKHQIVYETLVGGKKFRHDTGDSCVAIKYEGESQFKIVGSDFNEANDGAANIGKILLVDKEVL
jgi:hypothetical protein